MSWDAVLAVIKASREPGRFTHLEFRILVNLANHLNGRTGQCNPSLDCQVHDCGLDPKRGRRSVTRALDALETRGEIERSGNRKGGQLPGREYPSQNYRITLGTAGTSRPSSAGTERSEQQGPNGPNSRDLMSPESRSRTREIETAQPAVVDPRHGDGPTARRPQAADRGKPARSIPPRQTEAELEADRQRRIAEFEAYMAAHPDDGPRAVEERPRTEGQEQHHAEPEAGS